MPNPRLPAELLDHIVDLLSDNKRVLRNCCLVSKSWIPRTREHLFSFISFFTPKDLKLWKKTFPDPSASPACYTKTIFIGSSHVLADADAHGGCWLRGFSRVVHLALILQGHASSISLVAFHGFSPVIKSLYLSFILLPPLYIFDLILSFPLLEDLSVLTYGGSGDNNDDPGLLPTVVQSSSPPMLTGALALSLVKGTELVTRRLLSSPGGIHFRKLTWTWFCEEDLPFIMMLVEECSRTLESLKITYELPVKSVSASVNLLKTRRLKDVTFCLRSPDIGWVTMALQTITPEHRDLRQITIQVPKSLTFNAGTGGGGIIEEAIRGQWLDLDRLLVQFVESSSIRPSVTQTISKGSRGDAKDHIGCLLPELTKKGIIDLTKF